jgi:hypothetical protein
MVKQKVLILAGIPNLFFRKSAICLQTKYFRHHSSHALTEIDEFRKDRFEIVVVSASAGNWIRNGVIAFLELVTRLEVKMD